MEIVSCSKCGEALLDDTKGCPFCGNPSAKSSQRPAPPVASPEREPRRSTEPPRREHENLPEVQPRKQRTRNDRFDLDADPEDEAVEPPAPAKPAAAPPPPQDQGHKRAKYVFDDKFRSIVDTALTVLPQSKTQSDVAVMCPICRTHGFIPKTAVGQPLRCRNKECPAPVFVHRTNRPAEPLVEPSAKPASSKKIGIWVLRGTASVLVIAAIGAWWFFGVQRNKNAEPNPRPISARPISPPVAPPAEPPVESKTGSDTDNPVDPEVMRKTAYAALTTTFQGAVPHRKATGLRLSATAAALAGDFAAVQEQLAQFRVVPALAPFQYEAIPPLIILAWKHLEAGRQSAFLEAVVNASEAAKKLPSRGRFAAQTAVSLAALLAVADRRNEALQLVSRHQNGNAIDDAAAALAIAHEDGTFNTLLPRQGQQLGRWERPLPAAVTCLLMDRKQIKTASDWASAQPDVVARDECRLLWAALIADQTVEVKRAADSQLATLPGLEISPATQARWYARLAVIYHAHGLAPAAAQALEFARREYEKIPAENSTVQVKNVQDLFKLELPKDPASIQAAAQAAAEIAFTQVRLGQTDAAAKSLGLALDRWRKSAPGILALNSLEKNVLDGGGAAARQKMRQAMSLDDDDSAAREVIRFRQKLASLQPAAETRFRNQEQLLLTALDWGLADFVWQEVQRRHNQTDPNEQEPYVRSALPQLLASRFQASGKEEQQQQVETLIGRMRAVLGQDMPIDNKIPLIKEATLQLATQGQSLNAGELLASATRDDGTLELWTLQMACWQARQGKFEKVVELLTPLRNPSLREDALRLAAALATVEKHQDQVLSAAGTRGGIALESAAIYSGLLEGLARRPAVAKPAK